MACRPHLISSAERANPQGLQIISPTTCRQKKKWVAIIFRDTIAVKQYFSKEINFSNFESLNCTIALNNKVTFIGIIYRPPPSKLNGFSNSSFFKDWEDYLNHLMHLKQDILLTGDINFHLENSNSPDTEHFISILDSHNFLQHVDTATHVCGHILDFVATLKTSSLLSGKHAVHETFIADPISGKTLEYFAVTCKLALSVKSTKCKTIKYKNLKAIDVDVLNNSISQNLSSVRLIQDVDTQVNLYNNVMTEALDTLASIVEKRIQMRITFPWYNVDLKNAKNLCQKLERLWKKSKLLSHKLVFKKQRDKFNKLLYNSKKSFILSSIKTCKKDTKKKLYQIVGKFLKSCSSNKLPQIRPAHELPNAFATFFQNIIFMLHQGLSTNQSAVCAPEENDVVFDGTTFDQFNPVTTVDANNILHTLNSANCKLEPLSAVFLKKCSSIVINAITVFIKTP